MRTLDEIADDVATLGLTYASIKVAEEVGEYAALVSAVVGAHEAFVAAQATLNERHAAWSDEYDVMEDREAHDGGATIAQRRAVQDLAAQHVIALSAHDKARDEVMAAVAALAGRKG